MHSSNTDKIINIACSETGANAEHGILISVNDDGYTIWETGTYKMSLMQILCGPGAYLTVREYDKAGEQDAPFHYQIKSSSGQMECILTDSSLFASINGTDNNRVKGALYATMYLDDYFEAMQMLINNFFDKCEQKEQYEPFLDLIGNIVEMYINDDNIPYEEKTIVFIQFGLLGYERYFGCQLFPREYTNDNGEGVRIEINEEAVNNAVRKAQEATGYAFEKEESVNDHKAKNIDKYLEDISEEHHLAKNIKPNLFFEGICAYRCATGDDYELLKKFFEFTRFYKGIEQLDKKKALATGCLYFKDHKLNYAFDISRTGCDSYIDLKGVLPQKFMQ